MHIFVLGTGRSGTHWIGHILATHPHVRATIEKPPLFQIATQAALRPRRRIFLLPVLRSLYIYEERRSRPRHYADKSHPVIWYADKLANCFPEARFIVAARNPYGTVASMLQHPAVTGWQRNWQDYGVPNSFLGIDHSNADIYHKLSPAEKASLRWLSHHRQAQRLEHLLGGRLLVVDYDTLSTQFEQGLARIWNFLGLPSAAENAPKPRGDSQDKWRAVLTDEDIANINRITGIPPK